jgi:hypothetical protein
VLDSRRVKILALITFALVGIGFGIWLVRREFFALGCVWVAVFVWRAQQFAVWFLSSVKAPSDTTAPPTSKWQRLLLSIVVLLGAAVCGVGVYLSLLWPEQWQAGFVFVLFGLIVLAPITMKEIQSRRKSSDAS